MKRNNKKGFTIVELVIVIAVIAILSAVLIPTFGTVINDANKAARGADAKAMYTAYITECVQADPAVDPATELYIKVDSVYFKVAAGQLDTETELTSIPACFTDADTDGIYLCTSTETNHTHQ